MEGFEMNIPSCIHQRLFLLQWILEPAARVSAWDGQKRIVHPLRDSSPFGRHLPAKRKKSPSCGKWDERKESLPRNEDLSGTGAGSRSVRRFHQQPARSRLHLPAKRREGRGTENRDQKERKALNAVHAPVCLRKKFS